MFYKLKKYKIFPKNIFLKTLSNFVTLNIKKVYSGTSISGGAWDGRNWNWPHSPVINLYYEVLIYYLIASLFGVLIN